MEKILTGNTPDLGEELKGAWQVEPDEDEEKKIHEYIGINAALGLSLRANAACFDEENIEQVVFEGYSDEKGADFRKRLKNMINKYQSRINKTKTADQ